MEDTTNLWNKKSADLTVGDSVKLAVISPLIVMGAMAAAGGVARGLGALARKLRKTEVTPETPTE